MEGENRGCSDASNFAALGQYLPQPVEVGRRVDGRCRICASLILSGWVFLWSGACTHDAVPVQGVASPDAAIAPDAEDVGLTRGGAMVEVAEPGSGRRGGDAVLVEMISDCQANDMERCVAAGDFYFEVHRAWGKAREMYKRACDVGHPRACESLKRRERPVAADIQDFVEGERSGIEHQCEAGEAVACNDIGLYSVRAQLGYHKDLERARAMFGRACELGLLEGCNNLGYMYEVGDGVAVDLLKARDLFGLSCEGGNVAGCVLLGQVLTDPRSPVADLVRAREVLTKACEQGDMEGCSNLGVAFTEVPRDLPKARAAFERSCEGGAMRGCAKLALMYMRGDSVPRDPAQGLSLARRACDGGSGDGCYWAGVIYQEGDGVPADPRRAAGFFRESCGSDNERGCQALKELGIAPEEAQVERARIERPSVEVGGVKTAVRARAEWEPIDAVLLSYHGFQDWGQGIAAAVLETGTELIMLEPSQETPLPSDIEEISPKKLRGALQRLAAEHEHSKFSLMTYSSRAGWVRDFAPYAVEVVKGGRKRIAFVDTAYEDDRRADDFFPVDLASWLQGDRKIEILREEMLLHLSWGNFMTDGDGSCALTGEVFVRNEHLGEEDKVVPARLLASMGCDSAKLIILPRISLTIEHVDEIAKFLPGGRVLVSTLRVPLGPHAPGQWMPLNDVEETVAVDLDAVANTFVERGYEVIRVPALPPTRLIEGAVLRPYVNSLFVNKHILVPAYLRGGENYRGVDVRWLDGHVGDIFAGALPGYKVLRADVSAAVEHNGSLHCLTMGLPGLVP